MQTARFKTRAEPTAARNGGNVYHVYPWDHAGPRIEPSFTGLLAAYFREARHADWATVGPIRVKPGDTILVHAGVYRDHREHYGSGTEGRTEPRLATPFDGTYYLTADGTADAPITIKAAGDGEVVFDGAGNAVLFNMMGGDHHHFDGITVTQHGSRVPDRHQGHRRLRRLHAHALENRRRRARRARRLGRARRISTSPTTCSSGVTSKTALMGWTDDWKDLPGFPEEISVPAAPSTR